jgi:hypothetical protein
MREWLLILKDLWTFVSGLSVASTVVFVTVGLQLGWVHFAPTCPCHHTHDTRRVAPVGAGDLIPPQAVPIPMAKEMRP